MTRPGDWDQLFWNQLIAGELRFLLLVLKMRSGVKTEDLDWSGDWVFGARGANLRKESSESANLLPESKSSLSAPPKGVGSGSASSGLPEGSPETAGLNSKSPGTAGLNSKSPGTVGLNSKSPGAVDLNSKSDSAGPCPSVQGSRCSPEAGVNLQEGEEGGGL